MGETKRPMSNIAIPKDLALRIQKYRTIRVGERMPTPMWVIVEQAMDVYEAYVGTVVEEVIEP